MFEIPANWYKTNLKTSQLIQSACQDLEGVLAPATPWTASPNSNNANVEFRTWAQNNRKEFILLRLLSEAQKAASAVEHWGKNIKAFGDYRTNKIPAQRIGN